MRKRYVLVVDYDPACDRQYLSHIQAPAVVTFSRSNAQAQEAIETPDIHFDMFVVAPPHHRISGPTAVSIVKTIRACRPDCPIIVVAGNGARVFVETLKSLGAAHHATTPEVASKLIMSIIDDLPHKEHER